MNRVFLNTEEIPLPKWGKNLKNFTLKTLSVLGKDKCDLSVLLCGDEAISRLNARYRHKAQATDVLSFAFNEGGQFPCAGNYGSKRQFMGDIAISLDSLRNNALRFKICEDEELRRLLIHGILHLDGMKHSSNSKEEPMLIFQEKILMQLADERIIGRNA
ncbi:MAG: rRNA maturation RNase YbeY [Treponema sp.]|nr:rRNA maturation RNase YbeY [Treponema sp.]